MGITLAGRGDEVFRDRRENAIRGGATRRRVRDGGWNMGFIVLGLENVVAGVVVMENLSTLYVLQATASTQLITMYY